MKKYRATVIGNERGFAMVLVLMLITLLACLGIWIISQSGSALKITSAYQRIEETWHLAEGACWLSVRAIDTEIIDLPATTAMSPIPLNKDYLSSNQPFGRGRITPEIQSSRDLYNPNPPAGNMLNWQGATAYYSVFYLSRGLGEIQMPHSKGNARSILYNLVQKTTR